MKLSKRKAMRVIFFQFEFHIIFFLLSLHAEYLGRGVDESYSHRFLFKVYNIIRFKKEEF